MKTSELRIPSVTYSSFPSVLLYTSLSKWKVNIKCGAEKYMHHHTPLEVKLKFTMQTSATLNSSSYSSLRMWVHTNLMVAVTSNLDCRCQDNMFVCGARVWEKDVWVGYQIRDTWFIKRRKNEYCCFYVKVVAEKVYIFQGVPEIMELI